VPSDTKLIVNLTRGTALCRSEVVERLLPRVRGVAGRRELPAGQGLLLRPAPPVHTALTRSPIDALILDEQLRVLDIRAGVRHWRVGPRQHANAVLELAGGESHRLGVRVGDQLSVREGRPMAAVSDAPAVAVSDACAPIPLHASWPDSVGAPRADCVPAADAPAADPPSGPGPIAALVSPARADASPLDGDESSGARPMSVLVISPDRRFRSVTTVLIARRGCSVATTEHASRLAELADRIGPDVVVIDLAEGSQASAGALAQARTLARPVGIVLVDEEEPAGDRAPGALRVHGKWGPFPALFAAIEAADRERSPEGIDRELA
jgi:uncharacterized protein